ncbi:hypothetical protein RFI_00639 [Reticulomyxa filosa]|uniref:Uncharacterized protein n=1 Tax=Reticulomyxa filosa TaxID=46433 RepID=X6PEG2_RETFI|nr:hypothetical protein RFI_00639 [Reticulomyxa filosa]|eukprot:ETO36414.1 hypothetical protein RFI_00639 [Reticulomyxa filosa]
MPHKTPQDLQKKLAEKNDLENELKMLDSTEKPEEAAKEIMSFVLNGKEPLLDDDNPYRPSRGDCCEKCIMHNTTGVFLFVYMCLDLDVACKNRRSERRNNNPERKNTTKTRQKKKLKE